MTLTEASLVNTRLTEATLRSAETKEAGSRKRRVNLTSVDFTGATLDDVRMVGATKHNCIGPKAIAHNDSP